VPCPPFSKAGKQLGADDDRDLFPAALRLIRECQPRAVLLENVRGLLDDRFKPYRDDLEAKLNAEGYVVHWRLHQASDFGVPQLRPRTLLVALRPEVNAHFSWPKPARHLTPTVGEALGQLMAERGWVGASAWAEAAARIAPTLVGGSTKHGGPDLGPTRARREWERLGINGKLLAAEAPGPDFTGMPHLTVRMAAVLQGFPIEWEFMGTKTYAYRQVGNAFPPPVARAVGLKIAQALKAATRSGGPQVEIVAA
jgi:DNA (cytosine-5)-methyltransferase 1